MIRWILGIILIGIWSACEQPAVYTTPETPLEALQAGNQRFAAGHLSHPHESLRDIRHLEQGQHPGVIVMSCSDSRVPPEIVFDQGLGDIFSVRTAGNVICDFELGSIEYAVEHLGVHTIVVLGHDGCGAIRAYLHDPAAHNHLDHIQDIIDYIADEDEEKALPHQDPDVLHQAVLANIHHGLNLL
jgi:carbonic anhydrase